MLPLENLSPSADDEYIAAGLTEEIVSRLSKLNSLRVIARSAAMQYAGAGRRAGDIGRDLGVGALLVGSVRKEGDAVRIALQLINVEIEELLWSEVYDTKLESVLTLQRELAQRVADALIVQLQSGER
jgi:TolB-like protein